MNAAEKILRELVTRHAIAIDPRATLEDMPEALDFQIEMARALLREFVVQPSQSQVDDRADFEAHWAWRKPSSDCDLSRNADGSYVREHTQRHWWTWQCARAALSSQPSPEQAVVSDEDLRKAVDALRDPDTVSAFYNGYFTLTPDELRRTILALRPAQQAVPMTPEQIVQGQKEQGAQSILSFMKGVRHAEAHHGITVSSDTTAQGAQEGV